MDFNLCIITVLGFIVIELYIVTQGGEFLSVVDILKTLGIIHFIGYIFFCSFVLYCILL